MLAGGLRYWVTRLLGDTFPRPHVRYIWRRVSDERTDRCNLFTTKQVCILLDERHTTLDYCICPVTNDEYVEEGLEGPRAKAATFTPSDVLKSASLVSSQDVESGS